MKKNIKQLVSLLITVIMVFTPILTAMAEGMPLAPKPGYLTSVNNGTRIENLPANYKVLNRDGVSQKFTSYWGGAQPAGFGNISLNLSDNLDNIDDDMVAMVFYLDLSEGDINNVGDLGTHMRLQCKIGNSTNDSLVDLTQIANKKAYVNGKLSNAAMSHTYDNTKLTVSAPGTISNNFQVIYTNNLCGWCGNSGYYIVEMSKAELKAALDTTNDAYSTAVLRLPAINNGDYGKGMVGHTGRVQDIGYLTGESFEAAGIELENAYKKELNYVITNSHVYDIKSNWQSTTPATYYNHIYTNFAASGSIPTPEDGKSLKMVYYYDNTLNDVEANGANSKYTTNIDAGGSSAGEATAKVISVSNNGVQTTGKSIHPAYSYGYAIVDVPSGKTPADYRVFKNYAYTKLFKDGKKAAKDYVFKIGSFGYVVDSAEFEAELNAQLAESNARIQAAITAIDAIPDSSDSSFVAAVKNARVAYDKLDSASVLSNIGASTTTPEKNIVNALVGDETQTREEKLVDAENVLLSLDLSNVGLNIAPMPTTYNGGRDSTQIGSFYHPDSYKVINAEGKDTDAFAAYGSGTSGEVGYVNLGLDADLTNIPDDMSGLSFYVDLSEGSVKSGTNGIILTELYFEYEGKKVYIPLNQTSYNALYLTKKTNSYPSRNDTTYTVSGAIGKSTKTYAESGNIGFTSGYSYYISFAMTKAELVSKLETIGVTDYSKVRLYLKNREYTYGGAMVGAKAYMRDIAVFTGEYATAYAKLEEAYKRNLNYVPTNNTVYKVPTTGNISNTFYNHIYTNWTDAEASLASKAVFYYDNTANETDVPMKNGFSKNINVSVTSGTYYLPNLVKKIVYLNKDGEVVEEKRNNFPANSYGYVILNIPEGGFTNNNMKVLGYYTRLSAPVNLGAFGYLIDESLFVDTLKAKLQKSADRINEVSNKIGLLLPDDEGYLEAVIDAYDAYDSLDGTANLTYITLTPEKNLVSAIAGSSQVEDFVTAADDFIAEVQNDIELLEVTPASEEAIIDIENKYNMLSDVMKEKITNANKLTEAKTVFDAYRPQFITTHYRNSLVEGKAALRYVSRMGDIYDYDGYTLSGYGAAVVAEDKHTSNELTIEAENAIDSYVLLTDTLDNERENYFGTSVFVAEADADKNVLYRPYVVYTDDYSGDKYYIYGDVANDYPDSVINYNLSNKLYNNKVNDIYFGYYGGYYSSALNYKWGPQQYTSDHTNVGIISYVNPQSALVTLKKYNSKTWINIWDVYYEVMEAKTTGSNAWKTTFDNINQKIVDSGAEEACLGWYLDEPADMVALKTISEYAQKYGRRFFVCFAVNTVSPRSYGGNKGEGYHTTRDYTQYLTDVAFDSYVDVATNKTMIENIIEDLHNTCPENAKIWYVPGIHSYYADVEDSDIEREARILAMKNNLQFYYETLMAEANPGGLICFAGDMNLNGEKIYGIKQMNEATNGAWQSIIDECQEIGREICTMDLSSK